MKKRTKAFIKHHCITALLAIISLASAAVLISVPVLLEYTWREIVGPAVDDQYAAAFQGSLFILALLVAIASGISAIAFANAAKEHAEDFSWRWES